MTPARRTTGTQVGLAFGLTAAALCAVFVLTDGVPRRAAVVTSSVLAGGVLAVRLLRGRVTRPGPWWFVVAGMVALTVHNLVGLVQVGIQGRPVATGIGPMLTLPLGYVGLLVASVMVAFPYARKDVGGVIDGVIIALGAASLLWAFALHPALAARDAEWGDRLYRIVIILLVSGIAGAVTRALATHRTARPALTYLWVAVVLTLVGNAAGVITKDAATGGEAWWIGLVWIVAYLGLAAASAHPSHEHLATPRQHPPGRLTSRRLVFLGVALALNPVLAGVTEAAGRPADWILLSVASTALVPLVILRIAGLAHLHAEAEAKLAHLAGHDQLTGLPNRRTLDAHLAAAVDRARTGRSPGLVVLFCDLDGFKEINDRLGHHVGDELLAVVAARLQATVRPGDLVARFGGDEFVLVADGDPAATERTLRQRVERALDDPVTLGSEPTPVRASVGAVRVAPGEETSASELLSVADARMYAAKRRDRVRP